MKKFFLTIYLLLFISSVSSIFSQIKVEFTRNERKIEPGVLNKFIVYENDVCKITVLNSNNLHFRLEKTDEADLKKPVNFGSYKSGIGSNRSIFTLTGLKPGKIYSYTIKEIIPNNKYDTEVKNSGTVTSSFIYDSLNYKLSKNETDSVFKRETSIVKKAADTTSVYDFYVEVHEITHIEAGIGPVFSNLEFNDYKLTSIPGDSSGSKIIRNKGTKNQINFVLGAIIRPWGYDQRGEFLDWHNTYLYFGLGVNKNQNAFQNIFLGLGFGFRAFNIVVGAHINPVEKLMDGYSENIIYKENDIDDIDKIKTTETKVNIFGGLLIDLSIFNSVFSKVF